MILQKKKKKTQIKKVLYNCIYSSKFEAFVVVAIVISVTLLIVDATSVLNTKIMTPLNSVAIYLDVFFIIEYIARISIAPSKWGFFKRNLIDFVALFSIFRFFRLFRIIRLIRIAKIAALNQWSLAMTRSARSLGLDIQQKRYEGSIVILILIGVVLAGTIGILLFERGHNEQFKSFLDGLWWSAVTLTTVGYGDKFPITVEGRVLGIFIMFLGLSCFALITGFVSSFIIQRYKKEEYSGMDLIGLKNHIVVCGWNSNAPTVLKELASLYAAELKELILIAEKQPDYPFTENIFFVKGDFTKKDVLDRAHIQCAHAVIVLADTTIERNPQDIDARTILASLAVEHVSSDIYTCVEILDPDNIDHVVNAGVDEYIIAASYTGNMLAHSVKNPKITRIYQELLKSTVGNQIYRIAAPDDLINQSFKKCAVDFLKNDLGILIGLERNQDYLINPEDELVHIDDTFVYIARNELSEIQ